jgi:hypothetical protein
VAVNYNAAGARPPQSILLAVPSDPSRATWALTDLVSSVLETLELTRFRAMDPPADLPSRLLLPAIFVPEGISGLSLGLTLKGVDVLQESAVSAAHWRSFGDE